MRVVVDIPRAFVDDIRDTVEDGDYESPEEFLEQALRTQLELESGDQEQLPSFSEAVSSGESETVTREVHDRNEPTNSETGGEGLTRLETLSTREFNVKTVDPPSADRVDRGPLWGQYNRIFPTKLCLRRLAIVLDDLGTDTVPYDQFRDETARIARECGLRLRDVDDDKGRGRGEKFSAALPTGEKVESSLDRFKTHFVGQIDSSGNLTGCPPNLMFVDIDAETKAFGLTPAGLEFAEIENPLLDRDIESDTSLSDAERGFYMEHVANEHPAEYEAMQMVAEAIEDGINRPDPLSERIGELSDDWSSAQASTVRSGLVGRMYELELVARKRVGSRGIGYELTERGQRQLL